MRPVLRCVGGVCFGLAAVLAFASPPLMFVCSCFAASHEWCVAKHNRIVEDRRGALRDGGQS